MYVSFAFFKQACSVARHWFTQEHLAGAWLAFPRGHRCSFSSVQQGRSGSYKPCLIIHCFAYELHRHLYSAYQEPLLLGSGVLQHSDQLSVLGFIREIFSQLSADWSIWLLFGFIFFFLPVGKCWLAKNLFPIGYFWLRVISEPNCAQRKTKISIPLPFSNQISFY